MTFTPASIHALLLGLPLLLANKTLPCPKSGQLLQFVTGKVAILYLLQLLTAFVVSPPIIFLKSEVKLVFPAVKSPFVTKLEP